MKNLDNMTMAEIKEYVAKLEKTHKTQASMIAQYRDFMASVETFEKEMRAWVTFYDTQREFRLTEWLQNDEPKQEDILFRKYNEAVASAVASNSIAKVFDRFVKYLS